MDEFDEWFEKNNNMLVDRYVEENPDLSILDDDMADLPNDGAFQEWVENIWKNMSFEVRLSDKKDFRNYTLKYFTTRPEAERYAKLAKTNFGGYYRIIPNLNIVKHRCGRLIDSNKGCGYCEKIRYDLQGE